MKIFIVVKVPRGNVERRQIAERIAALTRQAGHHPFVAYQEIVKQGLSEPAAFMPFARQHVRSSGLLIVVYHPELRGGLIEMGIAYAEGIPIWLLHKAGENISSSALGCADLVVEYQDLDDLSNLLLEAVNKRISKPTNYF